MGRGPAKRSASLEGAPKIRSGALKSSSRFLPKHKEAREYYRALEAKHFSKEAVGSRFTEKINLEMLVERLPEIDENTLFSKQDDREYFRSQGITSFKEDIGYFRVKAKGLSRLVKSSLLDREEVIEIKEVKPGFLSFITDKKIEEETEEATLLVGKNPEGSTPFQVITTFPGLPHDPEKSGIRVEDAQSKGIFPGKIPLFELQKIVGKDLLLQSSSSQ